MSASIRIKVGTAPGCEQSTRYFVITHPFHPWRGQRFELIDCQRHWGQWWVYYLNKEGHRTHLRASWTDAGPKDPFVEEAQGRAIARTEDLLGLARLVGRTVNEIKPGM